MTERSVNAEPMTLDPLIEKLPTLWTCLFLSRYEHNTISGVGIIWALLEDHYLFVENNYDE